MHTHSWVTSSSTASHEGQHCKACLRGIAPNLGETHSTRTRAVAEAGHSLVWRGARGREKGRGSHLDTAPRRWHWARHVPGITALLTSTLCSCTGPHRLQCSGFRRSTDVCRSQPGPIDVYLVAGWSRALVAQLQRTGRTVLLSDACAQFGVNSSTLGTVVPLIRT